MPRQALITDLPRLLTELEAAELLRIHSKTLQKARQSGQLPFVRIGRCVRYMIPDLHAFIAAATVSNDMPVPATRRALKGGRSPAAIKPFTQRQH